MDVASLGLGVIPSGLDVMPRRRIRTYLVPLFSASSSTRNRSLKMRAILSLETSETIYQSVRFHIPEEPNLQQHRCENLKCDNVKPRLCSLERKIIFNTSEASFYQVYLCCRSGHCPEALGSLYRSPPGVAVPVHVFGIPGCGARIY